ncbi:MAG TPA: DUF3300 domain-containing protein [Aliidongia sp.]|nr:DUF3300 domain-containing protein [Aliidongia sp.]
MRANPVSTITVALIAMLLGSGPAPAQTPPTPPAEQAAPEATSAEQAAPQASAEQLDQLLAPIALYPDPLLAQILMAASYPLEVVQADRWLENPANAALKGDQLTAALEPQPWDPSVKSLVPFPQILAMMDENLDWTQRLGDAFVADQSSVMASVQQLRQRAEVAGKLHSTPEETVATEDQAIMIEPPAPQTVYVPVYDPAVAYGQWPYPAYPPYDFPDAFDGVPFDGLGFGWVGVTVVAPLWGWHHWDWHHRRINIDRDRFAALDHFHRPIGSGTWVHDPSHRRGPPFVDPVTRARLPVAPGSPGSMPRVWHGGSINPAAQVRPPVAAVRPQVVQQQALRPQVQVIRPQVIQPQVVRPQMMSPRAMPPAVRFQGRQADFRAQAERARGISAPAEVRPQSAGTRFTPSHVGGIPR